MSSDHIGATTNPLKPVSPNTDNPSLKEDFEEVASSLNHKRPQRWWMWLLLPTLLSVAGGLIYILIIRPMFMDKPPQSAPMKVTVADLIASTVRDSSEYVANLQSRQSVGVQPQVSGRVTQIYVNSGDHVVAGAPLLQIDAAEQQAQVEANAASVRAASADLVAATADLDSAHQSLEALIAERTSRKADLVFNEQEYRRFQNLYSQGATSNQLLEQKLNALRKSRASITQINSQMKAQDAVIQRSQANILQSRQQRDQALATAKQGQVKLRYYSVKAPINGTIGDIPSKVGDLVSITSQMLTVTQNHQLEIQVALPLEKEGQLRIGLPVQLLGQKGQVLQNGSISYIAPNVDPQNQSIQVKAIFGNSGNQLRTNQIARARVIWNTRNGVLVPTTAISRLAGKNFVFVAESYGGKSCVAQTKSRKVAAPDANQLVATQKPVILGQIVGNNQEVIKGLSPQDRIVISGLLQLQNCMPIQASPTPSLGKSR